jgi:hypothetical protein
MEIKETDTKATKIYWTEMNKIAERLKQEDKWNNYYFEFRQHILIADVLQAALILARSLKLPDLPSNSWQQDTNPKLRTVIYKLAYTACLNEINKASPFNMSKADAIATDISKFPNKNHQFGGHYEFNEFLQEKLYSKSKTHIP